MSVKVNKAEKYLPIFMQNAKKWMKGALDETLYEITENPDIKLNFVDRHRFERQSSLKYKVFEENEEDMINESK